MQAAILGVEFLTEPVRDFNKSTAGYKVNLAESYSLETKRLIFCTNAFTKKLLPEQNIIPARGQVLITKPLKDVPFKGIYHFDRGYYYFREIDGRILFGGGRNLDFEGEETDEMGPHPDILEDLKTKLKENILTHSPFEIDYAWSGIMGFSTSKVPLVKQIDKELFMLAGFGGMGVALVPYMARELVEGMNI